jgi:protocatechuate 3,4-dioxygenase beta subunit
MHFQKLAVVALSGLALAHPGHHEKSDPYSVAAKRHFLSDARRSLDLCASHLEKRGVNERARARRAAMVKANEKRAIFSRDTDKTVNTSHHSNLHVSANTPESELFSKNPTCILNPEGEVGPFWVKGELDRSDIRDGQPGIPLILDGQFIDINTCEPIKDLWWDVWSCNSTGVYSGVQSSMNGNGNDTSNLDKTFSRGIQKTDADGVAQFKTMFPGHYSGRATHIHVIAHTQAHKLANNTITGGHISHIGQLFFDQDLITKVEATYPYNTNTVSITKNINDHVVIDETEDSNSDPFFEYALLGDSIEDGVFGWITIGVNVSASHDSDATYAASLTASGGVSS